ncbi:hypothetical protein IQ260_24270, partial [Leptolyngbya cf. ectocarpi LEGE 11479]|nr:hypothetical protein [Leptolyngbya cf. ectocarpi LEGE 11479]
MTTDISDLLSGETVESTAKAAEVVFGLAEVLEKEGPNVQKLRPLVNQLDSLLDVLNSPLVDIIEKGLPFISIATGLLKFYLDKTKKPLTLSKCVALVSQAAYLESFKVSLQDENLLQKIGKKPASDEISQQTQELGNLYLEEDEARRTVTNFPSSKLAKEFGQVLQARLEQAGLDKESAQMLKTRVIWLTPRYMNRVWASSEEAVKHLGQPTFDEWRKEQVKYQSIDDYLRDIIQLQPCEKVFNEEKLRFQDIYVPLNVQLLDNQGKPLPKENHVSLEVWVKHDLISNNNSPGQILFIQGEAGRGKSVFCKMFADWTRQNLYPAYIPILIRLRQVKFLANNLTETLKN